MRQAITLLSIFIAALVVACSGGSKDTSGKLNVVATTTQIGDFARNVGGDRIALDVLIKPNQDAHDFEPQPSQSRAMSKAAIVLRNGLGLDGFVDKAVSGSKAKVVTVSDGVKARTLDDKPDPHLWFSVANAKLMVMSVRDAFVAADGANAGFYNDNATKYLARLDDLDAKLKTEIATIPSACRKLVTNHDVLGYYSEAYGFELAGSIIPSTSTEAAASASDVADIVRKIKAEHVPAIFAEASINPALIRQVGKEAGVKVVDDLYGDSLGPKGSAGATYVDMMQTDTQKIVDALKPCP